MNDNTDMDFLKNMNNLPVYFQRHCENAVAYIYTRYVTEEHYYVY